MGRRVVGLAVVALLALPGAAMASGFGNSEVGVIGEGKFGPNHFHIVAFGTNNGSAFGKIHVFDPSAGASYKADVVCLRVEGTEATLVGRLTHLKNQPVAFNGGAVLIRVRDSGKDVNNPTDGF